jgi:hypothetical protein
LQPLHRNTYLLQNRTQLARNVPGRTLVCPIKAIP